MSDLDIPSDLVQAKTDFLRAETRLADLSREQPPSTQIAAGAAQVTDEQQATWDETWAWLQALTAEIQGHPWWAGVDDVPEARAALMVAAKERVAQS
ncbi:hypothetical protein [Actinomadura litoris]|uniref:Uncharacterized protein n=1 Tax=Actinomadura litoris TaxID=2678616 RepID=A0A7K1LAE0_9ACTN|nr:hypothetical protein [Actinomadura litoris]MUN41384.1 hypothetical protein [Actinomadura litoris]